ncbi:RST domain [Dillenia turbinata]|uniref:RST domain n=1 Tax=Dillenia turbinata TaxID=194707 RepID=A0AAN8UPC6_9MAGN
MNKRQKRVSSIIQSVKEGMGDTHFGNSISNPVPNQEQAVSDCESGVSGSNLDDRQLFDDGFVRLDEDDRLFNIIKRRFISGLGSLGSQTSVVGIHRIAYSDFIGQARLHSFQIYAQAMQKKRGDHANMKYAWFSSSKGSICDVISHGFSHCGNVEGRGVYGCGLYLVPDDSSIESMKSSVVDRDGIRHTLLCRVILGKSEVVLPGSKQCHPSSEEFDSGVDNILAPKKYIVWSSQMNTHILPEYVISFRTPPCLEGRLRVPEPLRPTSPWMPFPLLISVLSNFLPPAKINLMIKYHSEHKAKKITRHDLIRHVRQIAGDRLLIAVIKSFRAKHFKSPTSISPTGDRN